MLKRLFIKLPLYIIFFTATVIVIPPLLYWIITGGNLNDWMCLGDKINEL